MPAPLADDERDHLGAAFKALADPTRLDIFRLIAAQEAPLCACDVVDRFDLAQPTISHHLKVLRESGLITVAKRGIWAYYAADVRGLERLRGAVAALLPAPLGATGNLPRERIDRCQYDRGRRTLEMHGDDALVFANQRAIHAADPARAFRDRPFVSPRGRAGGGDARGATPPRSRGWLLSQAAAVVHRLPATLALGRFAPVPACCA